MLNHHLRQRARLDNRRIHRSELRNRHPRHLKWPEPRCVPPSRGSRSRNHAHRRRRRRQQTARKSTGGERPDSLAMLTKFTE